MARIRTIKPEFWQDEDLAFLNAETRLLAIGLLNHADDEGYFKAHKLLVRAAVFPFSEPSLNIQGMLTELSDIGYIELFEGTDGKPYGFVPNFLKHQKVNRATASKIKGLRPFTEDSVSTHGALTEDSLPEGKGREQGKEQGSGKGVVQGATEVIPESVDPVQNDNPTQPIQKVSEKPEIIQRALEADRHTVGGQAQVVPFTPNRGGVSQPMTMDFQPDEPYLAQLQQCGIPEDFIREYGQNFVNYYVERGSHHAAWNSKFVSWIKRDWEQHRANWERSKSENHSTASASLDRLMDLNW